MTDKVFAELIAAEEAKRYRNWDPTARWKAIQNAIAWADAQQPVPRNSKQRCLELQRQKLAELDG